MAEDKPSIATQFVAASMVNKVLFDLALAFAKDLAFGNSDDGAWAVRRRLEDLSLVDLVNMTDLVPGEDFDLDEAKRIALESITEDAHILRQDVFE